MTDEQPVSPCCVSSRTVLVAMEILFFFFFFFSLWESARWFGHKCSAITEQWGVRSDEMKWHEWEAPCQGLPQCSGGWSLLSPTPLNVVQHLHLAQWMCVCVCVCVCMCVWRLLIMDAATLEHYSLMGDVNKPLVHYILGWGSCWPWLKDKICLLSSLDMSYFWWMLPFQNPARWNICCCFEMMHVAVSFCTEVINTRNGITPPPPFISSQFGLKTAHFLHLPPKCHARSSDDSDWTQVHPHGVLWQSVPERQRRFTGDTDTLLTGACHPLDRRLPFPYCAPPTLPSTCVCVRLEWPRLNDDLTHNCLASARL